MPSNEPPKPPVPPEEASDNVVSIGRGKPSDAPAPPPSDGENGSGALILTFILPEGAENRLAAIKQQQEQETQPSPKAVAPTQSGNSSDIRGTSLIKTINERYTEALDRLTTYAVSQLAPEDNKKTATRKVVSAAIVKGNTQAQIIALGECEPSEITDAIRKSLTMAKKVEIHTMVTLNLDAPRLKLDRNPPGGGGRGMGR